MAAATVKKTPASDADLADTLEAYGIEPSASAPVTPVPDAGTLADTLSAYGVVLKPRGKSEKTETVVPAAGPALVTTSSGKVVPAAETPPTEREKKAGAARGLRAQTISAIPIVGPAMDLAEAAIPVAGKANTFGQRFYDQKQADRAFALENPLSSAGAQVAGSLIGYGGIAKAFPALMGTVGPTLAARAYAGTAGGAGINTFDAALRGDNPIPAGIIGASGGLAGPLVAGGTRGTVNAIAQYAYPRPGPLKDVPRAGINILSNALEGETPASIAAGRARMGPHGFFGDLTPGLTDVTGAIADIPGPGKQLVREAYARRADEQGNRIEGALTRAMGQRVNVVDQTQYLTEARAAAADPLYEQWRNSVVHPTQKLQSLIPRLEKSGAFNLAEELSGISGRPINREWFTASLHDGSKAGEAPTTETWDYVKRGLDRRIDQAYSAGDKTLARELVNLKGEMIGEIGKTPAGKIWNQARSEFADRSALIDQTAAGRDTFVGGRSGTTVDEFHEELKHLSRPELMARIQGTRDIASEAMGASKNGDTSLRNKLLAPNNQEKLRLLLGKPDGDALIKTLREEEHLGNQTSNVLGNMQTGASGSMRSERKKMFDPPQLPIWDLDVTRPGTWLPPSGRPHNVLQAVMNDRASRAAPSLAPLMIERDAPRMDALVEAIRNHNDRIENVNALSAPWIRRGGAAISGPGQAFYRRHYENQLQLPPPSQP